MGDVLVVATANLRPDELAGWTVLAAGELAFRVATQPGVVRDVVAVVPPPLTR